jgi:hypothetical protein
MPEDRPPLVEIQLLGPVNPTPYIIDDNHFPFSVNRH